MKVLFTTNIPAPYRIDFFNELSKYCDSTVFGERNTASDRNAKWFSKEKNLFKVVDLPTIKINTNIVFCKQITQYIKNNKFDIIVVGGYSTPTGMYLIHYLNKQKIPFILNSDGGIIKNDKKIVYDIKKYFISKANGWLSSGNETDKYLIHYGADKDRIYRYSFTSIRKNDILNFEQKHKQKIELKKELGIKYNNIVLSVGRFIYSKGYDVLLEAINKIEKDVKVYIIGDEPTKEYIEQKNMLNLDNVEFLNFMKKDELEKYYKIADIFVLPTRSDVWGLVINEAMAKGLPIITTDKCVAGLELVKNDENGYIVPVEDYRSLAKAIENIIQNYQLKEKMEKNNIEKIKKYTIENMAIEHKVIFEKFLKESK